MWSDDDELCLWRVFDGDASHFGRSSFGLSSRPLVTLGVVVPRTGLGRSLLRGGVQFERRWSPTDAALKLLKGEEGLDLGCIGESEHGPCVELEWFCGWLVRVPDEGCYDVCDSSIEFQENLGER